LAFFVKKVLKLSTQRCLWCVYRGKQTGSGLANMLAYPLNLLRNSAAKCQKSKCH